MKVKILGWRGQTGQVLQIENKFKELGHSIVNDEYADLCYVHDSSCYEEGIKFKDKYPDTTLMLKVLDIPLHLLDKGFDLVKLNNQLERADKILANSVTVQKHILKYLGKKSHVVYDVPRPIKPVGNDFNKRKIDILGGGRLADPNKNGRIFLELEKHTNLTIVTFGPEYIGNKNHCGVISDEDLSGLYANTKFVLCPSVVEGINLIAIEAILAGRYPIINEEMTTANEFWDKQFHCKIDIKSIIDKMNDIQINYDITNCAFAKTKEKISKIFTVENIINNIIKYYQPF